MEMLQKCQLSENEAKRLVQYRNGQCYKRNAEQKRLLKLGHKPTHEEEKDEWSDKNVGNNLSASISVDDRFLSRRIEQNWTGVHNAQAIEIKNMQQSQSIINCMTIYFVEERFLCEV